MRELQIARRIAGRESCIALGTHYITNEIGITMNTTSTAAPTKVFLGSTMLNLSSNQNANRFAH